MKSIYSFVGIVAASVYLLGGCSHNNAADNKNQPGAALVNANPQTVDRSKVPPQFQKQFFGSSGGQNGGAQQQ